MEEQGVILLCRISPEVFRSFAMFDIFRRQKRWRAPALFAAIFSLSAVVCLTAGRDLPQSGLIGGVLLVVGLGLPFFYVLNFLLSVEGQVKKLGLAQLRPAYTVKLDDAGLTAEQNGEKASFPWEQMAFAYRLPQCLCLYPTPQRAFLLPEDEDTCRKVERAWEMALARLGRERVFDLRERA